MNDEARGRALYTPTSPTREASGQRRSRSWARRRTSSRATRRSRSRSSRRSRGRVSRCSPGQNELRRQKRNSQRVSDQRSRSQRASGPESHSRRTRSRRPRSPAGDGQRSHASSRERHRQERAASPEPRRSRSRARRRSRSQRSRRSRRTPRRGSPSARRTRSRSERRTKDSGEPSNNANISDLVSALKVLYDNNSKFDKLGSMNNTIPEFDPCKREQTMTMWLHKVNECASIYNWTEKQIVHFSLPKLKGVAQRWYEGLPSVLFTWAEWQEKLLSAFPSEENYGTMLSDMLAKRARFSDPLEDYYYEKVALINRCGIVGKRAVECILHGINDRSVRLGAEAAQYDDPNKLLPYLRNARNIKPSTERRFIRNVPLKAQDGQTRTNQKPIRCSNCKKDGHVTSQCTQPLKKCTRCSRIGHDTEQCYAKLPSDKTTMRVAVTKDSCVSCQSSPDKPTIRSPNDKYFKTAFVNGVPIDSFVDFGSESSMIKVSEFMKSFAKDNEIEIDIARDLPALKGFGNSLVQPIGRRDMQISIDGVEANVDLLIVPDDVMPFKLLVGQTYTEQPHIVVQKTSSHLDIVRVDQLIPMNNKINLYCHHDLEISGPTSVEVRTDPVYEGDVYLEGGLRNLNGIYYSISPGVFSISGGVGQIMANCSPGSPCFLKKESLIARGCVAQEEIVPQVKNVFSSCEREVSGITATDLKCGEDLAFQDRDRLLKLLNMYRACFAFDMSELGSTSVGEMSIKLQDDVPVVYRPYRLAITEKEKVRDMISELLDNNIIRPSTSPYASPIVIVRKKTGELRLCIDFRACLGPRFLLGNAGIA